jgi:hypothetical protein
MISRKKTPRTQRGGAATNERREHCPRNTQNSEFLPCFPCVPWAIGLNALGHFLNQDARTVFPRSLRPAVNLDRTVQEARSPTLFHPRLHALQVAARVREVGFESERFRILLLGLRQTAEFE